MNIHWNAGEYEKNFSFVHQYGEGVMELLDAPQGSLVVDLGCGNGALSEKLQARGYRVMGIDDSDDMLRLATQMHPDLNFQKGDARSFDLQEKADAIFSNAVFHWIDAADQDRMIANLYRNLKENGQLVCEFGGYGCAEAVHSTLQQGFEKRGLVYPRVFYFPRTGEYASRLEKAGFRVTHAFHFDRPTPQNGENGVAEWIRMFCKKSFENLDSGLADEIICEASDRLRDRLYHDGRWYIDYVRLRIRAVRPGRI